MLAAKIGVDAEETRRTLPRVALVPFDSEYKFMATFHDRPAHLEFKLIPEPHFMTVKGAPDVVIDRCSQALWHGDVGADGAGPPGSARRQPAAVREGVACPCLRRPRPLARRDAFGDRGPDGRGARPRAGLTRRHHRSAAPVRGRSRAHRARRRHRRSHDHRRPHGHRACDRRPAGPRPRRDHRRRPAEAQRRRGQGATARSSTSSAGSRPRTRCVSPA